MIMKLLPIILAVVGTGAGVGAGLMLKPEPTPEEMAAIECLPPEGAVDHEIADAPEDEMPLDTEFVKMTNQFIVPVMDEDRVQALVVASLSIEVSAGGSEAIYSREPKLRDVFLQVMFDHANIGGFEGSFTNSDRMNILRNALLDAARSVIGSDIADVLITEIARQDA